MYKILIIDDEENVREAIRILGAWDALGIDTVFEVPDGKSGMEILCEHKPDIVLLDTHMPEMDGVEFLQAAEKEYPAAVKIVVSGYDDFKFTRQAIRSKVTDYLLKPINREQLNNALKNAVSLIAARRKKQNEIIEISAKMNHSLHTLKGRLFTSAIEGTYNARTDGPYLKVVGVDDSIRNFGVAVLRVLNFTRINRRDFGGESDILCLALMNITQEICEKYLKVFCFRSLKNEKEMIIVLLDDGQSKEDLRALAVEALTRAIRKLRELLDVQAAAGVGMLCPAIGRLSESYQAALASLNDINLLDPGQTVLGPNSRKAEKTHSILSKMPLIRNAVESGGYDYAAGVLRDHLDEVRRSGSFSLREAGKTLNEFLFMMNDLSLEFDDRNETDLLRDFESSVESGENALDYADFEEFSSLLTSISSFFFERIRRHMNLSQKFSIQSIKDYIDKNYYQEIKISMFTAKYFLSKVYIMKLFKREYGCSIYEYVQQVRMKKAVELLKDPKINIQSIAQMVGYSSNNYFSKAFKNFHQISPSAYRLMALQQSEARKNPEFDENV